MRRGIILLFCVLIASFVAFALSACEKGEQPGGNAQPQDNPTESVQLLSPKLSLNENFLSWTAVENANMYEVYEGSAKVSTQQETSYTIEKTEKGEYRYSVKALSFNSNYLPSPLSDEVTYTVSENTQVVQLDAPVISLDEENKKITWPAVKHATVYNIYENGDILFQTVDTFYSITKTRVGEYVYTVIARSSDSAFSASARSNSVTFVIEPKVLETPVLKLTDFTLSWQEIEGAGSYNIYEDGVKVTNQVANVYMITEQEPGSYEYTVEAIPVQNDIQYLKSPVSKPVTFTLSDNRQPLGTPTARIEEGTPSADGTKRDRLVWDRIDNADAYDVYENGKRVFSISSHCEYQISAVMPATYEYQVRAISRSVTYKSGELSAPVEYSIPENPAEEFAIALNKDPGFPSQSLTVALFRPGKFGLPDVVKVTETTISANQMSATFVTSNKGEYIAKITSELPSEYVATQAKVSAANTTATISILKKDPKKQINVGSFSFSVRPEEVDSVSSFMFVAPKKGQYTISTNDSKNMYIKFGDKRIIDIQVGLDIYTFAADENEAIEVGINVEVNGTFNFSIVEGATKQFLHIGEGFGIGRSNIIPDGESEATRYLNVDKATKFTFEFTQGNLSNTRFVTVTINGVNYEFDGINCRQNITIAAGTNIEIKFEISGNSPTPLITTDVTFYFYPVL